MPFDGQLVVLRWKYRDEAEGLLERSPAEWRAALRKVSRRCRDRAFGIVWWDILSHKPELADAFREDVENIPRALPENEPRTWALAKALVSLGYPPEMAAARADWQPQGRRYWRVRPGK